MFTLRKGFSLPSIPAVCRCPKRGGAVGPRRWGSSKTGAVSERPGACAPRSARQVKGCYCSHLNRVMYAVCFQLPLRRIMVYPGGINCCQQLMLQRGLQHCSSWEQQTSLYWEETRAAVSSLRMLQSKQRIRATRWGKCCSKSVCPRKV